jgi:hypothetical protein
MKWPSGIHRKTFFAVMVADAVLIPFASYLAAHEVTSWLIFIPILVLNLPALPLAILFSIIGDGKDSTWTVTAMFACEAIVSGWLWGNFIASRLKKRTVKPTSHQYFKSET